MADIIAAYSARANEHADERASDPAAPRTLAAQIDVGELLRVFREPIEWVLARAERRAQSEPVDLAAIGRVREVIRTRSATASSGAAPSTAGPRVRATDLMIVAGVLAGTIDPAVVQHAALALGEGLADTLAAMLPFDPSLASYLATAAASLGRPRVPRPVSPACCCPHVHVGL